MPFARNFGRKAPSKNAVAITYIANCPPERRQSLTAEQVHAATGLNVTACQKLLDGFEARAAEARRWG
jgi:hypothetical protein